MTLFDKILGSRYPSSEWRRKEPLSISVDGDRGALCGVTLGQSIEALSFLGAADDPRRARQGVLCYFSLGLELAVSAAALQEVTLILVDTLRDGYEPFRGSLTCGGRTHLLESETNEQDAIRLFGAPIRRTEARDKESGDLEEVTLSYSSTEATCAFIVGTSGMVEEVRVVRGYAA